MHPLYATLTRSEREDRETERNVRPPPKTKPPRHDLRRNQVQPEEDPDLDPSDQDLSLNYKVVGSRLGARKVPQNHKPKWPGDYWKTQSAWGVWPPGARQPTSAPDEDHARLMAEGDRDQDETDPADSEDTPGEGEGDDSELAEPDRVEKQNQLEKHFRKVLKQSLRDEDLPAMKGLLRLESKDFRKGFRSYQDQLNTFSEQKTQAGPSGWAQQIQEAASTLGAGPEAEGIRAAGQAVLSRMVEDPANLGGVGLRSDLKPSQLSSASKQSFRIYRAVSPEVRARALNNLSGLRQDLQGDPDRLAHLEARIGGLSLACYLHGDEIPPGKKGEDPIIPEAAPSFRALLDTMGDAGRAEVFLMPPKKFFGPEGRAEIAEALAQTEDEDLPGLLEGGPFEDLGKVFGPESEYKLGPAQLAVFRDAIRSVLVEDSISIQGAINQARPKKSKKIRSEFDKKAKKDLRVRSTIKALADQIRDNQDPSEIEGSVAKLLLAGIESLDEYLRGLEDSGEIDPIPLDNPQWAKIRHVLKTGDLEGLTYNVVSPDEIRESRVPDRRASRPVPPDRILTGWNQSKRGPSGSVSGLSKKTTQEGLVYMAQKTPVRNTLSATVVRTRARIASQLDLLANNLTDNQAELQISPMAVKAFVEIADKLADHLDGGRAKAAADFNPDEIGEEVSGPLEDETPDDTVFPGHFTNQVNRELSELVESGKTDPPKTNLTPRGPRPGLQASLKDLETQVRTLRKGIQAGIVQVEQGQEAQLNRAAQLAQKALQEQLRK